MDAYEEGGVMSLPSEPVVLDGGPLAASQVESVARRGTRVAISPDTLDTLATSRRLLFAAMSDGAPHYGVNTGFGALGKVSIENDSLKILQTNLIRSHCTGVGQTLSDDAVRATMLLLCASLCRGYSGVRPEILELLVEMLNAQVTPQVPEIGSVGASGDLAPLAHIALVMIGEGQARCGEKTVPGGVALSQFGISPVQLQAKEGIALINGTHLMAGRGALLVEEFHRLFEAALVAAAMSVRAGFHRRCHTILLSA